MMRRILAIDPGNKNSAFVILDGLTVIDQGLVDNDAMLRIVKKNRKQVNGINRIEIMVVEMIASYGMAVGAEIFETVYWIGRYCQAWTEGGRLFDRIFRGQVKMHLCQTMRAKDGNIRQVLIDKLGPRGTKKSPGPTYGIRKDIWAALAVGVTWQETH